MNKELQFLIYNTPEKDISVNAVIKDETVWLTQKAMAELFGVQPPAISKHLKNIFEDGELSEEVVISKLEVTTQHGAIPDKTQTKETKFYNLDAIISVGYRVNSRKATQFRIWATGILKEFMIKGFALVKIILESFTLLLQGKQRQKSYTQKPITKKIIWGLPHGKI